MNDLKFKDISTEEFREYVYPDITIRIDNPRELNVAKSGGHRVLDAEGMSHYIPSGWKHLRWRADPPFSF